MLFVGQARDGRSGAATIGLVGWSPLLKWGAGLFFAGGIVALIVLAKAGGMAFGMKALHNLGRFLSDPDQAGLRTLFFAAFGVAVLGAVLSFVGVAAGDRARNRPCVEACREAGYETGVFRVSPHGEPPGEGPRDKQCWCRRNDEWSPEPLDVEPGR